MYSQSVQEAAHPSTRWRSLTELLDSQAARAPSAPAISFPTGHLSYGELAAESILAAQWLRAAGVGPGDRVGILMREGCVPYVTFGLGAMRLGGMCVPINARNKTHELSYVMKHARPRVLVTSTEFEGLVREAGLPENCRLVVLTDDGEWRGPADEAPADEVSELERTIAPDTPSLLLYTSGTTANPKGVVHTHATLIAVGYNTSERLELTFEDRYWTALAMFHVGGWQVLASALAVGACFSHVGFFNADTTLDQLERERVTVAMPAFELIWMAVLNHPRFADADLSALRLVMNVGVPERMERMQQMLPQAVQVSMVGMTESAGSICIGSIKDSLYSRTHTSGRPLRGMEVRVIDPETGEECPRGVPGELLFRGVTRFIEYYRDPAITASVIDEEGWARTGDLVRQEEDDTVAFMSRLKDMLKVGGENASAAEIEGYLITHPGVSVAAVVAAPDARYGEVPAAFVQKVPGSDVTGEELIDYCIGNIATYKVPRYVRFVEDFPTAASAKIQKFVLRQRIEAELREQGISEAPKLVSRR
ncbi:MAG TPA: class I adenylate-forming enzyme family protein [Solirubrobacteraceae bacterium]|nr:class I adenylate-forming enzyme family protein [Solirubrobacteraceae bacterium]